MKYCVVVFVVKSDLKLLIKYRGENIEGDSKLVLNVQRMWE